MPNPETEEEAIDAYLHSADHRAALDARITGVRLRIEAAQAALSIQPDREKARRLKLEIQHLQLDLAGLRQQRALAS